MKIILIAAHDPNLVIGSKGKLPWHYKKDLQFFKQTTMGYPIVMGRRVFEELNGKPLPGRKNIVLSKSHRYDHVKTFASIEKALEFLKNEEKIFIIGGGEIYRQTLPLADELLITRIHKTYEGDTFFPEYREDISKNWKEIWREDHEELSFIKYARKNVMKER